MVHQTEAIQGETGCVINACHRGIMGNPTSECANNIGMFTIQEHGAEHT